MKYDINSRVPQDWHEGHLGILLQRIHVLLVDKILLGKDYIIEKHNLLKKYSLRKDSQIPHTTFKLVVFIKINSGVIINNQLIINK